MAWWDVVWAVAYGAFAALIYLLGLGICVEASSHYARCERVAQSSRDGTVGLADVLDGPHALLLVQVGGAITAAIVGIRLASPWFSYGGAVLVAVGAGLVISAARCRSRLRPYAVGAIVVAGGVLLSPMLGAYLGAVLLTLAAGYEARVLRLLLAPDQATPARLHSVTAVLGSTAAVTALAATSPLLALLSLEVFFLGALLVYTLREESRRLAESIEGLGRLRPYGWLVEKSIPLSGDDTDGTERVRDWAV